LAAWAKKSQAVRSHRCNHMRHHHRAHACTIVCALDLDESKKNNVCAAAGMHELNLPSSLGIDVVSQRRSSHVLTRKMKNCFLLSLAANLGDETSSSQ
jgi:hypothetical protein